MLFRTVYGPELAAVHSLIAERGAVNRRQLQQWFIQAAVSGAEGTNLEEAVGLLVDTGLVARDREQLDTYSALPTSDFRLSMLRQLTTIYRTPEEQQHPLDPWFIGVLDQCFIGPNRPYLAKVHTAVNSLELPVSCSEEKVNAWRRVMEHLGCGRRVHAGFLACYAPDLVLGLLRLWGKAGPIERFLDAAEEYVPVRTATGELAESMAFPLMRLERSGRIELTGRGDYAGRAYLGDRRVKWVTVGV